MDIRTSYIIISLQRLEFSCQSRIYWNIRRYLSLPLFKTCWNNSKVTQKCAHDYRRGVHLFRILIQLLESFSVLSCIRIRYFSYIIFSHFHFWFIHLPHIYFLGVCTSCESITTCSECLTQSGCGWCGNDFNPLVGTLFILSIHTCRVKPAQSSGQSACPAKFFLAFHGFSQLSSPWVPAFIL